MENKNKILIVDDSEINRLILNEILSETYEIQQAEDGIMAISMLMNYSAKPDLVLLDILMPGIDGFGVMDFVKSDKFLMNIPVIFITAADHEIEGLRAGAVDYISKPFAPEIVKLRVANQLELSIYRENLQRLVDEKVEELTVTKEKFLHAMADLIEYRSLESGKHVKHTKELAKILVYQLIDLGKYSEELQEENIQMLIDAVPLHDVGKIGIPDNVLLKPGKLTPEEYEIIKTHTIIGGSIIRSLMLTDDERYLNYCYEICRHHHERWDGNGYPDGFAGENTPLSARIVSVVDTYDALTSERCYKKPIPHDDAMNIIIKESGKQFDPTIVDALIVAQEKFRDS